MKFKPTFLRRIQMLNFWKLGNSLGQKRKGDCLTENLLELSLRYAKEEPEDPAIVAQWVI
jgi:hypothetical protein